MADVSIEKLASDIGTTVDRLVGQFKDAGITTTQGAFSVGVSIGHASYPEEGKTLEELIYIADERMFEDKKQNIPSN